MAHGLLAGTLNPRAAALFVGLRHRNVYHHDPSILFDGLYLDLGAELVLSASLRPALYLEWLPIKIFRLRLQYEFWGWLGFHTGTGHGIVFPSASAPFDQDTLISLRGQEQPGIGHRASAIPTLQLKLGPIILLSSLELAAWLVHGDGGFWLEPANDNLLRRGALAGTLRSTTLLLYELWAGERGAQILAGALLDHFRSFSAGLDRTRLGAIASITPWPKLGDFDRPTLLVLGGVNVDDTNREGEAWLIVAIRVEHDIAAE